GELHAYAHRQPAPALAVRSVGPEGGLARVKPTIAYPSAVRGIRLTAPARRAAANRRAAWVTRELRAYAAPHMGTAAGGARASGVAFDLPYNAAAIEVRVPFYHEFAVQGSGNVDAYRACGWNQTTYKAWCADSGYWQAESGGDASKGC